MSCEFSTSTLNMTALSFFAQECEGESQIVDGSECSQEQEGVLKTDSKPYHLTLKQNGNCIQREAEIYKKVLGDTEGGEGAKLSTQYGKMGEQLKVKDRFTLSAEMSCSIRPKSGGKKKGEEPPKNHMQQQREGRSEISPLKEMAGYAKSDHQTPLPKQSASCKNRPAAALKEKNSPQQKTLSPLSGRHFTAHQTKEWWTQERYHQKERQGGGERERDQEDQREKEELKLKKSASIDEKKSSPTQNCMGEGGRGKKPQLAPPKIGIFALYYILTKMGIEADGGSTYSQKQEIEGIDLETSETHKKRLEEIAEAIKKEKQTARWGIAAKVFSWIAALAGIVTGVALIASGVGAVAGAMLIVGGLIQVGSHIMEMSGGWQKVFELLPGEDDAKKKAVISWMQIGVALLCLVLSGVGILYGGFSQFSESMGKAMYMIGHFASVGTGITTIGEGMGTFMLKNKQGDIYAQERKLAELKHMRKDLMETMEGGLDRLEKLFEDLAKALAFEEELFQADLMLSRR